MPMQCNVLCCALSWCSVVQMSRLRRCPAACCADSAAPPCSAHLRSSWLLPGLLAELWLPAPAAKHLFALLPAPLTSPAPSFPADILVCGPADAVPHQQHRVHCRGRHAQCFGLRRVGQLIRDSQHPGGSACPLARSPLLLPLPLLCLCLASASAAAVAAACLCLPARLPVCVQTRVAELVLAVSHPAWCVATCHTGCFERLCLLAAAAANPSHCPPAVLCLCACRAI